MRIALLSLLFLSLGGCATNRMGNCLTLAGPGWIALGQKPANARNLLALENLPADSQLIWLGKGPDQLLACYYARGITNPGCGGSEGYRFVRKGEQWTSQGQVMDFCDNGPS